MAAFFQDRRAAGKELAKKLAAWAGRGDVIVLALPRGGVPVAFEAARFLHAPLDLMLVRKIGVPGQEELALGAVALPDIKVFNREILQAVVLPDDIIDRLIASERKELERRNKIYRGGVPPPALKGRTVILVDDGMATGADMRAAVEAVAQQEPACTVVAVPVASRQACQLLEWQADDVVCLETPDNFYGVGQAYADFPQTSDAEVLALLAEARQWGKGGAKAAGGRKQAENGV